ncbi:hypothetical protein ACWIGW_44055 [Nocardia brasiliensis]
MRTRLLAHLHEPAAPLQALTAPELGVRNRGWRLGVPAALDDEHRLAVAS